MDAELANVLASGSAALAGAVVTDMWVTMKTRLGALFGGRDRARGETVLRELEEVRADVTAARDRGDEDGADEAERSLEDLLRERLNRLVEAEPSLIGEVRDVFGVAGGLNRTGATVVVGGQTQVSNVYNFYATSTQHAGTGRGIRVPRITVRPTRHYQNNDELLRRMDGVWARCRAEHVPAVMYLVGVPGIGRSALVRRWLHRHQSELTGPQLEASLGRDAWGNVPDPAAILDRWFRELGVPAEDVPADPDDRRAYFRTVVEGRRLIVVLEDVVLASQVRQLLPETADSVVFLTSHSLLPGLVGTYDAEPLGVEPLSPEHSRRLLVSMGRMGPDDADRYAAEVDAICRVCQGLPLALCVVGAQVAVGPSGKVRELAQQLSDPMTRLGALSVDEEFSVAAALGPVYRGLEPEVAHVYRCIGLLPAGEFEADVVRAVLPELDTASRHEALRQLTSANLIEPTDDNGYRVRHALIHAHALGCAHADEPAEIRERALDRIIDHYLEFAERSEAALSSRYRHDPMEVYAAYAPTGPVNGPAVIRSMERRREALLNVVRLAHTNRRHDRTWRLAQALHTFHLKCHLHSDWIATHEWAVRSAEECGDPMALNRMRFEYGFGRLDRWSPVQGDPEAVGREFEWVLARVRAAGRQATEGERRTESSVLEGLGLARRKAGEPEQALEYFTAALEALDGIDHQRGIALLALHRGRTYTDLGRHDEAAFQLLSARAQFAALATDERYNEARALTLYAEDRRVAGRPAEGVRALDEAITLAADTSPAYQRADILLLRGRLRWEQGDARRAAGDGAAARDLFREANSLRAREAEEFLAGIPVENDGELSSGGDVE